MTETTATVTPDVTVHRQGTVFLVVPVTRKAIRWTERHADAPSWSWKLGGIAVDQRYARELVDGMKAAGLVVQ